MSEVMQAVGWMGGKAVARSFRLSVSLPFARPAFPPDRLSADG